MSTRTRSTSTARVLVLEGVEEGEEACPRAVRVKVEAVKARPTSTRSLEATLENLQSRGLGAAIAVEDLTS